jgi:hypothetical protein
MEKYQIIRMFHMGFVLWNITLIQINVFKVCLHIDLFKDSKASPYAGPFWGEIHQTLLSTSAITER